MRFGPTAALMVTASLASSCGLLGSDAATTCDIQMTAAILAEPPVDEFIDSFELEGPLDGYVVNNPDALPAVSASEGRYRAVVADNSDDRTLHFHAAQGRLDAVLVEFPFEAIATNIGIGTVSDSQVAPQPIGDDTFIFAGMQIHGIDLDSANSSHLAVGHRGWAPFTLEGKNTCGGESRVTDEGEGSAPLGRLDLRIVGTTDRILEAYYRAPGSTDDWTPYRDGGLPGAQPPYTDHVYVGLITSAQGDLGIPYVGTADAFEIRRIDS